MDIISASQIRGARAMLKWRREDLAEKSGVSAISVKNIESGRTDPRSSTITAIQRAFTEAGLTFVERDSVMGAGVRFSNS